MNRKWSTLLFCVGGVLLFSALAWTGWNLVEDRQAGSLSQEAGQAVLQAIIQRQEEASMATGAPSQQGNLGADATIIAFSPTPTIIRTDTVPETRVPAETLIVSSAPATEVTMFEASASPATDESVAETPIAAASPESPMNTSTSRQGLIWLDTSAVDTAYAQQPELLYPDTMPTLSVDGNQYIGLLEIPALALSLPVMAEWSYPNLKIAPCRFSGTQQAHNLIIIAHNYVTHFGRLNDLRDGDDVYFTDVNGRQTKYLVHMITTLSPMDVESLTGSGYDLSLVTCSIGGTTRVAVYCETAASTND